MAYPASGFRVFTEKEKDADSPEQLSLGRWMSISGAAFSAAAGANTSVPIAILAGMFNVRLGYWWYSGTPESNSWFSLERLLPVQAALKAETLAQTKGTSGRYWNLSDGGHFENMGGYELIRRRAPVIVIIDAESDADYVFQGLSDLVRKARLDFEAEVVFLNDGELSGPVSQFRTDPTGLIKVLPDEVRRYFGGLGALRRGKLKKEPHPNDHGQQLVTITSDRDRISGAHAALAKVKYRDGSKEESWLVYIKATLMGDEPEDVCHYHRSHPDFPQETTIDQFFDEAQWESYRRLGLHIGHRVLTPGLIDHLKKIAVLPPV